MKGLPPCRSTHTPAILVTSDCTLPQTSFCVVGFLPMQSSITGFQLTRTTFSYVSLHSSKCLCPFSGRFQVCIPHYTITQCSDCSLAGERHFSLCTALLPKAVKNAGSVNPKLVTKPQGENSQSSPTIQYIASLIRNKRQKQAFNR